MSRNRFVNCNTSKEIPSTTGINKILFITRAQRGSVGTREINEHSNNDCKYNKATAASIMETSLLFERFLQSEEGYSRKH